MRVSVGIGGWVMLFRSSVYLLFWPLGVIVFAVLGFLAVDMGLVDWAFGTATQKGLKDCVAFLGKHYGINRPNIQLALQIIGLGFTISLGTSGFMRALHYAKENCRNA
jgi:hypothetical protein